MNSHSVIWRVTAHLTCLGFGVFLCFIFSRRDAADIQSGTVCTDGSSITAQAGIEASVQSVIALLERNKGIRLRWSVFLDRMWPVDPPGVIFKVFSAAAVRQAGRQPGVCTRSCPRCWRSESLLGFQEQKPLTVVSTLLEWLGETAIFVSAASWVSWTGFRMTTSRVCFLFGCFFCCFFKPLVILFATNVAVSVQRSGRTQHVLQQFLFRKSQIRFLLSYRQYCMCLSPLSAQCQSKNKKTFLTPLFGSQRGWRGCGSDRHQPFLCESIHWFSTAVPSSFLCLLNFKQGA